MSPETLNTVRTMLAKGLSMLAIHYATGVHVVQLYCVRADKPIQAIPKGKGNSTWSPEEQVSLIEQMCAGLAPSQIAIPGRTRNAIISIQHRYNLTALIYGRLTQSGAAEQRMADLRIKAKAVARQRAAAKAPPKLAPALTLVPKPAPKPKAPPLSDPKARMEHAEVEGLKAVHASMRADEGVPVAKRMPIVTYDDRGRIHANEKLKATSCRWPIGDPVSRDFGYCGHPSVRSLPYCEGHAHRAFAPPTPRRRRATVVAIEPPVPTFADAVEKELL